MRTSVRPVLIVEPSGAITVDREALREAPEYKRQIEALKQIVREGIGKAPPRPEVEADPA